MNKSPVYLIDGTAYIYRAYHAISPLSNTSGLPTHAVYGFASILRRMLREKEPIWLAVAFDTRGPVFRHRIYEGYKANRPPMPDDLAVQIPYIRKLVAAYNIPILEHEDQEADDLIAAAANRLAHQGYPVVVVSGDKDLLQLVNDSITIWDPMKDMVMDQAAVEEKYGLGPDQLLDYFALTGDSADNIPGVRGVGPKTALKLIEAHSDLEGLYAAVDDFKQSKMKERIIANRQEAFVSRDLIRLNIAAEVPGVIDSYAAGEPDVDTLRKLLTELEFFRLLKEDVPAESVDTELFHLIQDSEALASLCKDLTAAELVVVDTETDSLNTREAQLVGVSLCIDLSTAWYLPCGHRDEVGELVPGQLGREELVEALRPILENPNIAKVGHNIKYDLAVLQQPHNGRIKLTGPLYDTMIGAWLLDPGRRSYKLDDLCSELDLELTPFSTVVGGDKSSDAFCRVGLEAAKNYSCEDVYGALRLFNEQQPQLEAAELWQLFVEVEGPLIPVLAAMETAGVSVNSGELGNLSVEFGTLLDGYEQDIYQIAGQQFNINSPKQLGVILFEDLGLPKGRKTKTGYSTDVKVLERLSAHHELPGLVLKYRNLAKLKSTYVDKLAELRDDVSGRIHTSYNQCGTATGRLSSSNPNLQNIPIRTVEGRRIRASFVAEQGCLLLSADYSQIDLRVLAHYSKDPALVDAFQTGLDIHQQTAAEIFFVAPELITPEMRRVAKSINFGIVYGMSSFGLSNQLNVSRKEAQTFIDRYFAHYSGIKEFMESVVVQARADGFVTTLLGRRRLVPEITSSNRTRREFAERTAINTPIQGTAADIIKLAMLKVHEVLTNKGYKSRMILQVHDELVLEVVAQEEVAVSTLLTECMESALHLDVPLVVNVHSGQNLGKV